MHQVNFLFFYLMIDAKAVRWPKLSTKPNVI
uniref:Uncharacterized protein n=1 Tax=Vitis vinifera TaxID=29760 RepID=F6H0X7_VITVI